MTVVKASNEVSSQPSTSSLSFMLTMLVLHYTSLQLLASSPVVVQRSFSLPASEWCVLICCRVCDTNALSAVTSTDVALPLASPPLSARPVSCCLLIEAALTYPLTSDVHVSLTPAPPLT